MKAIRIFLLILIIIGVILLLTQKIWVPKIVEYIIHNEKEEGLILPIPTPISTTTPIPSPVTIDSGVDGTVTIGPTCPVMRNPPDPACADKGYQTTLVVAGTLPGKAGGMLVFTDAKGHFSLNLIPGKYTVRAQSTAMLPRMSPTSFEVTEHNRTRLSLSFDSGIR